jgi:hypothetical protein
MIGVVASLAASGAQLSGLRKLISQNISSSFGLMSGGAAGGNSLNAPPPPTGAGLAVNVKA